MKFHTNTSINVNIDMNVAIIGCMIINDYIHIIMTSHTHGNFYMNVAIVIVARQRPEDIQVLSQVL